MLVPRQQYPREMKIATMRELDAGKSMAEVARMYQVSPYRLMAWRGEWRAKGEMAFPGHAARLEVKLDAERIPELERKIGQQAMEIDFFKKALRRFREQVPPVVVNGATGSTSKSAKRSTQPKRRSQ
ncbi:MAG TPA: transposase [Terriglobales bacterium]|nr:transposase [Terriglobales bacterium]